VSFHQIGRPASTCHQRTAKPVVAATRNSHPGMIAASAIRMRRPLEAVGVARSSAEMSSADASSRSRGESFASVRTEAPLVRECSFAYGREMTGEVAKSASYRPWTRPMVGRDPDEPHRASTPLELLFDLCFVVAVSQAAEGLHRHLGTGRWSSGVVGYFMVFFAIWWAWMNFTWFASAYDTDDVWYRLLTLLQIVGVLILAAGVPAAFDSHFKTMVIGYIVMRIAMAAQWLRAARGDPVGRPVARAYALGISLVQLLWLLRLGLPSGLGLVSFIVLAAAEIAVPILAERRGRMTTWHPAHISERYSLFTLIVLGEVVAAATLAVQAAIVRHGFAQSHILIAAGGLLLVFGIWWSYYQHSAEHALRNSTRNAFTWGYLHYFVFASIAALGTGLELSASAAGGDLHLDKIAAALCVAVPVAVYLVALGMIHGLLHSFGTVRPIYVGATAALVLVAALCERTLTLPGSILAMGLIFAAFVAYDVVLSHRVPLDEVTEI
jgi:low temperature requirement protein LtrA